MKLIYPANKTLFPFQEKAINETINFLESNQERSCYNACEMGLGKTIQAIVTANSLGFNTALVICPAIMRLVWESEIKSWSLQTDVGTILSGSDITHIFSRKWQWLVISYDLASSPTFIRYLDDLQFDILICDEAHYLKNSRAKRTKTVLQKIWPHCHYRLCLSGTPCVSRVVDTYTIFHRMLPSRFPDFPSFADEFSYCQIKNIGGRMIHDYFGIKNALFLHDIIRSNFFVRYTKDEVLKELPAKTFVKITLPDSVAGRQDNSLELQGEAAEVVRAIEQGKEVAPLSQNLATYRRLLGERKIPSIVEFTQDLLEQDIPLVLFAWHKSLVEAFREAFKNYNPSIITGDTPAVERRNAVDAFQAGNTPLFLGTLGAAGVGVTLARASVCVLAELAWSPAIVSQAVDRLHRIGQKNVVTVYYFSVSGSLDESIEKVLMNRVRDFKKVLD